LHNDQRTAKQPSVSLVEIFLRAKELERKGCDVIHFDAGEPDYDPPKKVVDATAEALAQGKGRYTESGGIPQARNAIAAHIEKKNGVKVSTDRILVTAGGRLALYYSFSNLPKHSKIGIISPDWPAYRELARLLDFDIRFFKSSLDTDWNLDLDELSASDCNAIVLNYPNNPTGKILDLSTFEQLVQLAREKKMTLISDEVYSSFTFNEPKRFKSVLETSDLRYIFVTSLSKDYAMTGFRAAYAISDPKTISAMSRLNGLIMTSAPEFVQYAIVAAMECDDYVAEKVSMIRRRRDVAVKSLKTKLNADVYVPDGSLYLFPRISDEQFDSEAFSLQLLEKKYVSVAPGTTFGNHYRNHFRMTLLQDENRIEEGIERMAEFVQLKRGEA
jgi:aspartate aminotransferase